MSEDGKLPESGEQMMNCPKCGFDQPVDQYCAKCGVDMAKAQRKSSGLRGLLKNPAAIAGVAILLGGIGFLGYRNSQSTAFESAVSNNLKSSTQGRSKSLLSAKSSAQITENLNAAEYASQSGTHDHESATHSNSPDQHLNREHSQKDSHSVGRKHSASLAATPGAATPGASSSAPSPTAAKSAGILVVFAWAEVSKEWLQSIGAAEPLFHQVPGLEGKLRQSTGAFRVLEATRRRLTDEAEPVVMNRGDQSVYFEPLAIRSRSLTGGFTAQYKTASGEIRAPATATASLLKGTGAVIPMGPSTTEGTEIVVFILPRWEND